MLRSAPLPTPAPPARPAAARAPRTGTGRVRAARGRACGSAQRQRRRQQRQQQGRQRQQQEQPLPARASVLVCREAGKNGALLARLRAAGVKGVAEVPLIEHAEGEDVRQLPGALAGDAWAWVAVTSPEAAKVFSAGWHEAGRPAGLRVASVGGGTSKALEEASGGALTAAFEPTAAHAEALAAELPLEAADDAVLYPASARAASTLQEGLAARGFAVTRLNTYDTRAVAAEALDAAQLQAAAAARVVAVGSPSALKAWLAVAEAGGRGALGGDALLACIGGTSARAAARLGFEERRVFAPAAPGMDGWESAILEALARVKAEDRAGGEAA